MADAPNTPRRKKLGLHWQIIIGLVLGIVVGLIVNVAWTPSTWSAVGVDHPSAFLDPDKDDREAAMVPVTGLGSESLEAIPDQDVIRARAEVADRPDLAEVPPLALTSEQAEALGFDMKPANEDANIIARATRLMRFSVDFLGDLFMRCLRFIAVPIVLFSLIVGVSSLNNIAKLSRIGGKTIGIYLVTTAVAISFGLLLANIVRPGNFVPQETRDQLLLTYQAEAEEDQQTAARGQAQSGWERLVNLVPSNPFNAIANGNMLQVVVLSLAIGIGITLIPTARSGPVIAFCEGMTDAIIKLVEILMRTAPVAVFALIVIVVADLGLDVLGALLVYSLCVVGGLALMAVVVYPLVLKLFTGVGPGRFYKAIAPAQLLAFSSASSSATLPVTMECVEKRLGVKEEVSSFVLPLGATINMDGTALYQGVAAVFIAQLYSMNLGLGDQLAIVGTATLASIGTAGVPGAGVVMLVIVLQSVGVPLEGIAAILGVDRLLDMCRTTCNVTGDAMVATVVAGTEGELSSAEEVERQLAEEEARGFDESPPSTQA
ncbi:MAG: dicarboxylate/amino acid:cation symporter [Planctomycetota bacterium]